MSYTISAYVVLVAALLLPAVPGFAGTVLTAQDASAIVGGCGGWECYHWGQCNQKRCYEPGYCENCSDSIEETWYRPGTGSVRYGVVDNLCGYRKPYGFCLYSSGQGVCIGGQQNQLVCPGKVCIPD